MSHKFTGDHPKREFAVLKLAEYFKLSNATQYNQLERNIQQLWQHYPYKELIRPLVAWEKENKLKTLTQIAITYGVSRWSVGRILQKSSEKQLEDYYDKDFS